MNNKTEKKNTAGAGKTATGVSITINFDDISRIRDIAEFHGMIQRLMPVYGLTGQTVVQGMDFVEEVKEE